MIPIVSLDRKLHKYRSKIDNAINSVLDSGSLILGPHVLKFEESFAEYIGINHCVSVANGTDALEIALRALGATTGTKVITAANAGHYTTTAINLIGAIPVYIDVNPLSRSIDFENLRGAINSGAEILVVTHLYGLANPDILQIAELCSQFKVKLIEDCAQSHGAEIDGRKTGTYGDISTFSFYPTKNLGALGDGGAIVTNSNKYFELCLSLRTYGWTEKYDIQLKFGRNSRLDEIQAAVLIEFLQVLDLENSRRRDIAQILNRACDSSGIIHPEFIDKDFVAHLYVIEVQDRTRAQRYFAEKGVATAIHYPISDHKQGYLPQSNHPYLPVTEQLEKSILTLPCFPEMTTSEVELIVEAVEKYSD
jgi:dTDP-4-amino-4,6-dideoxygalactose transaminase